MGWCYTISSFLVLMVALGGGLIGYFVLRDGELPDLPDRYWGPGSPPPQGKEDSSIRPFPINVSEKVLSDLKTRLQLEVSTLEDRVADTLEGVGFEYGVSKSFLRKVTAHWLNKYDWRQREKLLNAYPNFKTKISGLDIHFQHVKPTKKTKLGSKPILLLHGWPGSFIEVQKLIPLLTDSKDPDVNFEVIVPSLPGFGFSESASKPGLGASEMGQVLLKLMKRLGHEKFYVHGTDWGSFIASDMATLYKDNVLGIHMTMCSSFHPRTVLKFNLALMLPHVFMDEEEQAKFSPITKYPMHQIRETGYLHIQATKPDSLGVALSFSPTGLAAYLLEKFSYWTNDSWLGKEDGGILSYYKLDELLDNVMVHWLGKSSTTAMRIYRESLNPFTSHHFELERVQVQTPVNCLRLPSEPLTMPMYPLLEKYPKLKVTKAKVGGHFNGMEIPDVVTQNIINFVKETENDKS